MRNLCYTSFLYEDEYIANFTYLHEYTFKILPKFKCNTLFGTRFLFADSRQYFRPLLPSALAQTSATKIDI